MPSMAKPSLGSYGDEKGQPLYIMPQVASFFGSLVPRKKSG